MLHVVLYEPEIPPNTGNIIRLCANMGATLHLIHPLGFELNEKACRRAGLDYQTATGIQHYKNWATFREQHPSRRCFACSTKAQQTYTHPQFRKEDAFVFGPESRGLPEDLLTSWPQDQMLRIPMQANSRSLNLANAVSIIAYEAWRQLDFFL